MAKNPASSDKARRARIAQLRRALARLGDTADPEQLEALERALGLPDQPDANEALQRLCHLAQNEERLRHALEASRDGLWDWHLPSGRIYFSPIYLSTLGYQHDDIPGSLDTFRDLFLLPEDAPKVLDQFQTALESGRPHINLEFRLRHKDGRVLWIYCRSKFVDPDAEGRPQRCVGTNANITDFIHSQEQLLEAKAQAERANSVKGEFLARMSHEIRTPMNAIVGLGHLLRDTSLNARQRSYLNGIGSAAESLLSQLNELLDFAKIETGSILLENHHFDLDKVLARLARRFETRAEKVHADIVYDIRPDVPRFLRGDASRLEQVIGNLLDNALTYSDSQQILVKVKCKRQTSRHITLQFAIIDFGVGMAEDKILQLQYKLAHPYSQSIQTDAGFGLSICLHLVSLMQGQIQIESSPQQGCSIVFTARFEHSQIGPQSLRTEPGRFRQLRTLIVDDNPLALEILQNTAHSLQLRSEAVASATEALVQLRSAAADKDPYRLLLIDYKMPDTNGLEALSQVHADERLTEKPKSLLISSFRQDEIFADKSLLALVDGFLHKPVSGSQLFDSISQLFQNGDNADSAGENFTADMDALLAGMHVLLAEDNLVNQQVASGILRKKGVKTTVVDDGRKALAALKDNPDSFDVILMDLEMPHLDGFETTRLIRAGQIRPDIPIIALTAQAMRDDRQRCLDMGMNNYITKPIKPWLLYRLLFDIASGRRTTST